VIRPLEPHELPFLQSLGREIRRLRLERGLTNAQLAFGAELSEQQVSRIQVGRTRTRRSTLTRIAMTLLGQDASPEEVEHLLEHLVELGGPGIAPESPWAEKQVRTRARRKRRREREEAAYAQARARRLAEEAEARANRLPRRRETRYRDIGWF
jgi:transcriptional regulator with XRE-family HTH domain